MTEGTILEWHAKVGDAIKLDETIVEISTDKVDVELPSPATGTVSEILVAGGRHGHRRPGDRADRRRRGWGNGASGNGASAACRATEPTALQRRRAAAEDSTSSGSTPRAGDGPASAEAGKTVDVLTPAAGESVTEGTILEWHAKVGEFIKARRHDRRDLDRQGRRRAAGACQRDRQRAACAEGDTVTVGQVIARIAVGARPAPPRVGPAARDRRPPQPTSRPANGAGGVPDGVKVTPVAARAAAVEGVDLANVSGSGPGGQNQEVRRARRRGDQRRRQATARHHRRRQAAAASSERLKGGAAALARYMEQSLTIPTATSFRTLPVTVLDARRRELKAAGAEGLLHAPDRLRDRARGDRRHAGDGDHFAADRGQAPPGRRRRR